MMWINILSTTYEIYQLWQYSMWSRGPGMMQENGFPVKLTCLRDDLLDTPIERITTLPDVQEFPKYA